MELDKIEKENYNIFNKRIQTNTIDKITPTIIPVMAALDVAFFQKKPNKKTGKIAGEI